MKKSNIILSALIVLIFAYVLFSFRWIFSFKYEPEYYEDLYYHSQYNIPQSTRGISDGMLYKFVGYRLTQGENPFNINWEAPPFGKYLYGLSERLTGNPYWVSIGLYILSVAALFLLLKEFFVERSLILLSLLLFITTPFVITQIDDTMLDLPLMFLILTHVLFFVRFLKDKRVKNLIFSGVFLGLATGTKIGIYTPFIIILGLILTFRQKKSWPVYFGSIFGGYVISYISYFLKHPNPIPWIKLHQKPIEFYLQSGGGVDYLNQWKTIFLNTYQGWWGSGQAAIRDWSLVLPLGVISAVLIIYKSYRSKDKLLLYVSGLVAIFLLINTLIPFWPRYLMPTIPLFVLLLTVLFRNKQWLIIGLVVFNIPFLKGVLIPGDVSGDAGATARFVSTRAYRELYRSLTYQQRSQITEDTFINSYENFLESLKTRSITADIESINKGDDQADIKYRFDYVTQYGEVITEPTLHYVLAGNQWHLRWDWNYIYPGYEPNSKVEVGNGTIALAAIEDSQNQTISQRGNWKAVYIIPQLMYDWGGRIGDLSSLTGLDGDKVDQQVKLVVPDKFPRFVGYLNPSLGQSGINRALQIPGVSLADVIYQLPKTPSKQITDYINQAYQKYPQLFYQNSKAYLVNGQDKTEIKLKQTDKNDVVIKAPSDL